MPQHENDPRARDAAMHDAKRFEQTTEPSDLMQAVHQLARVNRMKDHAGGNASAAWRYWIKEETARQSLAAEFAKQHKLDNPDEIESALKIFFIAETYRHKKTDEEELTDQAYSAVATDTLRFACRYLPRKTIAHLWKDSQHDDERAMHTLWQVARIEKSDDYKHAIDLLNLYTIMAGHSSVVKTLHSSAAEEIIPKDRLHGMRVCWLHELTDRLYPTKRYSQDELYQSQTLFAADILEQAWRGYNENSKLPLRMATGLHNRFHSVSEKFKLEGYYKNHKRDLIKTVQLIERCGVRTLMDVYEHTGISMLGDLDSKQIDLMKHVINKDPQTLETLQNKPVTVVLGNTPLDDHNGAFFNINQRHSDRDTSATLHFEVGFVEYDIPYYVAFLQERGIQPSTVILAGHGSPGVITMGMDPEQGNSSALVGADWSLDEAMDMLGISTIDIASDPTFAQLFALMKPDSQGLCRVVLHSCFQGSGSDYYEPVAASIAHTMAVARSDTAGVVYASPVPVREIDVIIEDNKAWLGAETKQFSTVYHEFSGEYEVVERPVDPPVEAMKIAA